MRVRNALTAEDVSFAVLSEYVGAKDANRARTLFQDGRKKVLLVSTDPAHSLGDAQVVVFQRKVKFLFDFSCAELEWVAEDGGGSALFKGRATLRDCASGCSAGSVSFRRRATLRSTALTSPAAA